MYCNIRLIRQSLCAQINGLTRISVTFDLEIFSYKWLHFVTSLSELGAGLSCLSPLAEENGPTVRN